MPAPATTPQIAFLNVLHAERVPFGYDPDGTYDVKQASALISLGKAASRKEVQAAKVDPGYYITAEDKVYVVVQSKQNADRTYAKVLVLTKRHPLCDGHESLDGAHMGEAVYCDGSCQPATTTAAWVYVPGAVRDLVGLTPLSLEAAAKLGRKHGVCMICAKTLMDDVRKGPDGLTSIQRGIGPTCAKRLRSAAALVIPEGAGTVVPARPQTVGIIAEMHPQVDVPNFKSHDCQMFDGECRGWAGFHGNVTDVMKMAV